MRLSGKVAIVTGAAQGIGQVTAEVMAREGASVVIGDINEEGAARVAEKINKSGGRALAVKVDVSKEDEVKRTVERTIAEFSRVDILVNNAALMGSERPFKSFAETELAEWRREIDVVFIGTLLFCKAVIGHMLKQEYGRIINVSSDAGKHGVPFMPIFSGVKAAVAGFTRALALDVARRGITVNCVSPGPIRTPSLVQAMERFQGVEETWKTITPMGRAGEPEDIARMIVFLASDEGNFITGQDYSVDGGIRM